MDQPDHSALLSLDLSSLETPVYIVDEVALERNLQILKNFADRSATRILLALKAFAQFSLFPLIGRYLHGATASSLFEARLAFEELGGELHACAPAYIPNDFPQLASYCDHIVFNSFNQWQAFRHLLPEKTSVGLRINPEHSTVKKAIYDPCARGSRLGIRKSDFINRQNRRNENSEENRQNEQNRQNSENAELNNDQQDLEGICGLHFHTLCEQRFTALEKTLALVEQNFGHILKQMEWINLGGGHLLTSADYDLESLVELIGHFRRRYPQLLVYLEPGEAVARDCGLLMTTVLDIVSGGKGQPPAVILDSSAAAHMPDVLEMPYRPQIIGAGELDEKRYSYSLGGLTCLAGDVIGSYSFDKQLKPGQRLYLLDMAHYTMVKNNFFNGLRLPGIAIGNGKRGELRLVKSFHYSDYRNRLS